MGCAHLLCFKYLLLTICCCATNMFCANIIATYIICYHKWAAPISSANNITPQLLVALISGLRPLYKL